jgi:hypothetical protein
VSDELSRVEETLRGYATSLTEQRGLEASIADGLKQDAMNSHDRAPDEIAMKMLTTGDDRATFWFSRVLLLQAIARRCVDRGDAKDARTLIAQARRDKHPFVRETARLCQKALRKLPTRPGRPPRWEKYIWRDMTEVAAGAKSPLAPITKQLIGEIALSLNMNEHAREGQRNDFGKKTTLPACIERSRHRGEIVGLSGPIEDCPYQEQTQCLCPYTYHAPNEEVRRELSRAFCRDQRMNAQRLRHSDINLRSLKEFWREMEELARF